ncbi:hypothetical protein D9M71_55610 [compost metagenome]
MASQLRKEREFGDFSVFGDMIQVEIGESMNDKQLNAEGKVNLPAIYSGLTQRTILDDLQSPCFCGHN